MLDPKSVVTQVKQGDYPSDWRVYHGHGNYGLLTVYWLGTAGICFIGAFISALGGINVGFWWLYLLIFSSIGGLVVLTHKVKADEKSLFVLLPTGVVQYDANDPENIGWLYFPTIKSIELDGDINSRAYYWLDIYWSDGSYLKWGIDTCFGDTTSIGKSIIAAYHYYWRQNSFFHL
jgi:hypothetical protein